MDLLAEAQPPRLRYRIANNLARERADVVIPKLPASLPSEPKIELQFKSISDLITAVDDVPAYWELDSCGRVRVLMKLASQFAKKVEVLTAFAVIAPAHEVDLDYPTPWVVDHSDSASGAREK